MRKILPRNARYALAVVFAAFFLAVPARAQDPATATEDASAEPAGVDSGNYHVTQTLEFGYREDWLGGNMDTYNTFVNLGSGLRLFDYTLDMRSLNHNGLLFDDLHFSNFGYGGDPDDVSRLQMDKNKWYNFQALFRRDKNYWDWNLWANPLNPVSTNSILSPTTPALTSPHSMDLVRRMQDYDLTLLPQSSVRFRVGYSRNRDEGPGFFTTDGGTISAFNEAYSYTTNAARAGVDFRVLPHTTLSYDEFLTWFDQNNAMTDNPVSSPQNFGFQAPNGTLVDPGLVWASSGGELLPCPVSTTPPTAPIEAPGSPGVLPTLNPNCNGYVSYSQTGQLHDFMPTEQFRFETSYFHNLDMSGSLGYSSSDSLMKDFNERVVGWTTRSSSPGSTTAGPEVAKRISVNANWSATYDVTDKLRLLDNFLFDDWRIPGLWNSLLGALFTTGGVGLGSPVGTFLAANCDAANSYNGPTCPSHALTSAADLVSAINANFLKQDMKSNTVQMEYDFSPRYQARIGHLYTHREIVQSASSFTTQQIFYPGGPAGTAANDFLAARGPCAPTGPAPGGGLPPPLPSGCVLNADGSVTLSTPPPTLAPTLGTVAINENALLLGLTALPVDALRITGDFAFGYNDNSFTRMSPRQLQSYKTNVNYTPRPWANFTGTIDIGENRDNVETVNSLEHDRTFSFDAVLAPNARISLDFGYSYWDVFAQAAICYSVGFGPPPAGATPCATASSPVPLGALSVYTSADQYAYAAVMWKPIKRVVASVGFNGSFVSGTSPYFNQPQFAGASAPPLQQVNLNPLTSSGSLDFRYLEPAASLSIDLYKGLSYKTSWSYYGYNNTGFPNAAGLAAIPFLDFNGSTATFSVRYAF